MRPLPKGRARTSNHTREEAARSIFQDRVHRRRKLGLTDGQTQPDP